ncbi:MAG: four helix bundle protein [Phycisphaerae bacterium]|nr:MAG: four helix bundle protein [Planctomycetota bacterium]KAB2948899.1 MAG: four helix bundle protein [Phycisphaerae bacterium]MBE7457946.1 four helix bundle protein [Planctomycetia bacterium]MCK6465549.1 four helix bundle protein [Phycisphaerae bacterium]MCL4719842.1 four helix bundle protein [Phycisphaerae bacterium]
MQCEPENKGADRDIAERTLKFALRIIKVGRAIPKSNEGAIFARQVLRSGTSVGANVEEAQAASSKREFVRRINIARAEAKETLYWLRLIGKAGILPMTRRREILKEADAIVRVLTAIEKSARG